MATDKPKVRRGQQARQTQVQRDRTKYRRAGLTEVPEEETEVPREHRKHCGQCGTDLGRGGPCPVCPG